jgi:c-di-GMP-binding flagellar brake protein YcgR
MPTNFMDELFYPGNTVQLEFRTDLLAKTILLTRVISIDDERLQLELPLDQDEPFTPIKIGTLLTLSARERDSVKVYYYTTELLEHQPQNLSLIIVKRPSFVQNMSRRNFFRCDVDLLFYYWLEETCYRGRAVNLSASGLFGIIDTNPELDTDNIIPLEIMLPTGDEALAVEGKIIRIVKTDQPETSGIAFHYHNPTEKLQNQITKYLFQRQRELIQEGRIKIGRLQ